MGWPLTTGAASSGAGTVAQNVQGFYDRTLLERAVASFQWHMFGQVRPLPKQKGTRINFRRYNSLAANTTALVQGMTPAGKQLSISDIYATVAQYGDYVVLTDELQLTVPDPVVTEAAEVLGEQAGDSLDQIFRAVLVAGTSVIYANDSSRVAVNTVLVLNDVERAIEILEINKAKKISSLVKAGPNIATEPVAPGYFAISHVSMRHDISALAGFVPVEKYANQGDIQTNEIGKVRECRFILNTQGKIWLGGGATSGTNVKETSTNADVYGTVVFAKNAYGIVPLGGVSGKKPNVRTIIKQLGSAGTEDPLDQRSSVGWKVWTTCKILNDAFMTRIESACTDLTA